MANSAKSAIPNRAITRHYRHVVFGAEVPCGSCSSCKKLRNDTNLCDNPISVGSNFSVNAAGNVKLKAVS